MRKKEQMHYNHANKLYHANRKPRLITIRKTRTTKLKQIKHSYKRHIPIVLSMAQYFNMEFISLKHAILVNLAGFKKFLISTLI